MEGKDGDLQVINHVTFSYAHNQINIPRLGNAMSGAVALGPASTQGV